MGKIDMQNKSTVITKQELLKKLNEEGIKITSRTLTYYMDLGLIPKGNLKYVEGVRGSVSFFKENVLFMIKGIKKMTNPKVVKDLATGVEVVLSLKLKEVVKFKNLVYDYNEMELTKYFSFTYREMPAGCSEGYFAYMNERGKLEQVVINYAFAEAGLFYEGQSRIISDNPTGDDIYTDPPDPGMPLVPLIYTVKDLKKVVEIRVKIPREDPPNRIYYTEVIYSKKGIEIKQKGPGD